MSRQYWSLDDEHRLIELACDGVKYKAIASELGRSRMACIAKADRLRDDRGIDIPLRNWAGRAR